MSTDLETDKNPTSVEAQTAPIGLRSLPRKQINATLVGVLLAMFLSSLDQNIVGTAMPRIIADLGGFAHYTWVTTAYIITSTIALPITGKLTDMYGRKRFYVGGLTVFALGSLFAGLSQTMVQIILARGFQGIGAGMMLSNAFAVAADLFPPAERGKYQGMLSSTFGLSAIMGPVLGGYITDSFSWQWVFLINVPLGIALIFLFLASFPDFRPEHAAPRVDYWGATVLILALVPAMLALSWGGRDYPWLSAPVAGMFVFSAGMTFLFVRIERRAPEPILPHHLFRNTIVTVSILISFFSGIAMFGAILFVPLFFQGVLGLSATTSGSFLTPMILGMVLGSVVSGQALSRLGGHYRLQGALGLSIMALGTLMLSRMNADTGYVSSVVAIVLMGVGIGATMPLYTIAIQNAVPYRIIGAATSAAAFFRSIGGAVGLAVFGSVMGNRFASLFVSGLPSSVRAVVPADVLSSVANEPQALVSISAQTQLRAFFVPLGEAGNALFDQLLAAMRQALSSALNEVFLIALVVVAVSFVINLFLKEVPLRKHHTTEEE